MNHLAAILLAAGKGTRMKSQRAKVTFPIAGKPMVQRVVNTAIAAECHRICVVVGYQKDSVIGCLEEDDRLEFVEQTEQLGTGHAVSMCATGFAAFDGDILILSGDVPLLSENTLRELYAHHDKSGAACTVLTAFLDDPGNYGRIVRGAEGGIEGIVEYRDATPEQRSIKEWNTGIYCFNAKDLFYALSQVSNANDQGEYYLTDTLAILLGMGKKVTSVVLENQIEVAGVNSQQQLAELEDMFVGTIRDKWLNSGVVIHNPKSVWIDDDVVIEPDVEIGANCHIQGKSHIESGVVIGPNCYIDTCRICENSILEGFNILRHAHIPENHIMDFTEQAIEEELYE